MKNSKGKHSGWVTPKVVHPQMKYCEIVDQALEPQPFYDDWMDYRDGIRDWPYLQWKRADKNKKKWQRFQKRFYRIEKRVIYGKQTNPAA